MMTKGNLIRFDWAAKRLLRQKANFVVLEGLLSVLIDDKIKIVRLLESEGNKKDADDKFNRIDILAETENGELVIIEVQNERELDYFHRMLYGVCKAVTEYIYEGSPYSHIKKVYSVNILYFELGQGEDYLYRGRTDFRGVFKKDRLRLTIRQAKQFKCEEVGDLYPEYFILRVNEFDKEAITPLDEWFLFLKTGEISEDTKAPGLPEAKERLRRDLLSKEEQQEYDAHVEALRYQKSVIQTSLIEGRAEGRAEGEAERDKLKAEKEAAQAQLKASTEKVAINSHRASLPIETISIVTGLTREEIITILKRENLI